MTTPTTDPLGAARCVGRPRSEGADAAIAVAALEVFAEEGFDRFTMETVAKRAKVGKATLYRRFASRQDLLNHAVQQLNEDIPHWSGVGDFWEGLETFLDSIRMSMIDSLKSRIMVRVLNDGSRYPHLLTMVNEGIIAPRRAFLGEILSDGINSGVLRSDLDIEATMDLLVGPMVWLGMLGRTPAAGSATTRAILLALRAGLSPASH